jgi:hypothetical protein
MADKRDYPEVHFVEEYEPGDDACVVESRVAALFMDGRLIINNCGLQLEPGRKA